MVNQVAKQIQGVMHQGHAGLIMASEATVRAVLAHGDVDARLYQEALDQGRLQVLDAELCIGQLTVAGKAAADHFRQLIAKRMRRLAKHYARVQVYSEVVTLLCERDDFNAAMSLEELWIDLAHEHRYDLVCGYSMDLFVRSKNARSIERIRRAHDQVIRS